MSNIIQINGQIYDHTSLKIGFLSNQLVKDLVKGVNFSHGFTVGDSYGTSPVPLPRNRGKYKATGSIEVFLEAWDQMLTSGALPDGYLEMPSFPITLNYKSFQGPLHKIEMKECSILKVTGSSSSDQNAGLTRMLELYVRIIFENGISPVRTEDQ